MKSVIVGFAVAVFVSVVGNAAVRLDIQTIKARSDKLDKIIAGLKEKDKV